MPSIVSAMGRTAIRLAWWDISIETNTKNVGSTHVFDVRARVNSDNVAVLDTEVVADNTVDASLTILEIVVGENNQDGILALLSLDQNGVATEELKSLHGVVGEGDDGVVIVGSVGDTESMSVRMWQVEMMAAPTSMSWASSSS